MLIGRGADLQNCLQHIADTLPFALVADAGLGKTTLLQAAADACGRRTFIGRGLGTLSWVSYLSLETALGAKVPHGDHASVASAVERRVGEGVLVLDDLQWADEDTLRVVSSLSERIRMLAAVRTDDPGGGRARSVLEGARFELHALQPLTDEQAEALLRARRPDLTILSIHDIARRAGGNPLLLEELSAEGEPSKTLQISVAARMERLSRPARRALGVLALLGRPGRHDLTGPGLRALAAAGLVVETPDGFTPRHALLAEAAAAQLTDEERRRTHATIASKTTDPGEAARHHQLAGDLDAARREAVRAAEAAVHVGQRGRLLLIAARAGRHGAEDDDLRLRGAEGLCEAGDYEEAYRAASEVRSSAPEIVAESLLLRARALRGTQGLAAARGLVRKGLSLVDGSGSLVEIRLLLEDIAIALWRWDPEWAVPAARHALKLARGTIEEVSATRALGAAMVEEGNPRGMTYLRRAIKMARGSGDVRGECDAAFYLVSAMKFFKQWRDSLPLAAQTRLLAMASGLRGWEIMFIWHEFVTLIDCAGDLERAIRIGLELVSDVATPARLVQDVAGVLALALLDVGRIDDALDLLDRTAPDGPQESIFPYATRAELALATGDPLSAITTVDEAAERFPREPNLPILWVTRAWACLELGRACAPFPGEPIPALDAGYSNELEALIAMSRGDAAAAERSFQAATRLAHDLDIRAEMRCWWAAGDAAAKGGATDRAKTRLFEVESRAQALGMKHLLARIHTSLRAIGVRRSTLRSDAAGALTGRERQVLVLIAKGYRTRAIAARLGITRSTVDSIVRSAMTKLGARTRIEAAQRQVALEPTDLRVPARHSR